MRDKGCLEGKRETFPRKMSSCSSHESLWGWVGMGYAGLGTTIPISSWVQNCNSHQSLRPGVLLVTIRGDLCWILNLPHSQSQGGDQTCCWGCQAKLGQLLLLSAGQRAGWEVPQPDMSFPRETGTWGLAQISGGGAAVEGEQSWEGRLPRGGIPSLCLILAAAEKDAAPESERATGKAGAGLGCRLTSVGCGAAQWVHLSRLRVAGRG